MSVPKAGAEPARYDFEGSSPARRLAYSAQMCVSSVLHGMMLSPFDVDFFQSFVKEHAPVIGSLSTEELQLMRQIQSHTKSPSNTAGLLSEYRGPRNNLPKLLKWYLSRIEDAKNNGDRLNLNSLLDFEGFESVQKLWDDYQKSGWRAKSRLASFPKETTGAQVFPHSKEIQVRLAPPDEPMPLMVAEEIFHVQDMDYINHNGSLIQSWVRQRIASVNGLDKEQKIISLLTGEMRVHLLADLARSLAEANIPDENVRYVVGFLLERDAMYKKLELYKQLRQRHPEFKSKFWEQIFLSPHPREAVTAALNKRFNFSDPFLRELGVESLEEIALSRGGATRMEVARRQMSSQPVPAPPWKNREAFLRETPRVLWDDLAALNYRDREHFIQEHASKMTADEAQSLAKFLAKPEISMDPYAVERKIEKKLSANISSLEELSVHMHAQNMLAVHAHVQNALRLLSDYDKIHKTSLSIDSIEKILAHLQPNRDTGDYRDLFWLMSKIAVGSPDPTAVSKYFHAINSTPAFEGWLGDENFPNTLHVLLEKAEFLAPEKRPDSDLVAKISREYINRYEAKAKLARDFHAFNDRDTARRVAYFAAHYFQDIHDSRFAEMFTQDERRLHKDMNDIAKERHPNL